MNDKEFDNLMKNALSSEKLPEGLNERLLERAEACHFTHVASEKSENTASRLSKNKKIIYPFRWASSVAAVFICAIAVLNYFNSDTSKTIMHTETEKDISVKEEIIKPVEKEAASFNQVAPEKSEGTASGNFRNSEKEKEAEPPKIEKADAQPENKTPAVNDEKIIAEGEAPAVTKEESLPEAADYDASSPAAYTPENDTAAEITEEEIAEPVSPKMMRMMKEPLFTLFSENYDFKAVINKSITEQIEKSGRDIFTFTSVTGNEDYRIEHDGSLFIIFPEGSIASEEFGHFEFCVGKLTDGILEA